MSIPAGEIREATMDDDVHASTIGGYALEAELGRGATGIVYRAHGEGSNDVIALKVLNAALLDDETFRVRFAREIEAMRRLRDEHCVAIYDSRLGPTSAWIAMEYIHGATLRAVLARAGRLTPPQACGVLLGALGGLGAAHALGLVHRDFKPDNVLVDVAGTSKLADFGLVADRQGAEWSAIEGSPAYMSPEQVRGEELDARSDLYAAGAVLYELLTGRPPYVADSPVATLHAQVASPPPSVEGLPPRIGVVVLWALSKAQDERPATAQELANAIREAADSDLGPLWIAAAGIAGLVGGALGADAAAHDGPSSAGPRRTPRPRRAVWLAATAGIVAAIAVPTIAFSRSDDGNSNHAGSTGRSRPADNSTSSTTSPQASAGLGLWTDTQITITPTSLGGVRLGMSAAQAQAAAGVGFDESGDGFVYPSTLPAGYPHDYVGVIGSTTDYTVHCVGTGVAALDAPPSQRVTTPEGFQLGDTKAALIATYGTAARYVPAPPTGMTTNAGYVVTKRDGVLAFVLGPNDRIVSIAAGGAGTDPNTCTG